MKKNKGFTLIELFGLMFFLAIFIVGFYHIMSMDTRSSFFELKAKSFKSNVKKYNELYGLKEIEDFSYFQYLFDADVATSSYYMSSGYKVRVVDDNKSGFIDEGDVIIIKVGKYIYKNKDIKELLTDCTVVMKEKSELNYKNSNPNFLKQELYKLQKSHGGFYGCSTNDTFGYEYLIL